MPNFSISISADGVAWYGAIVATMAAYFTLHQLLRDRAKIRMKYEPNMYIHGDPVHYPETEVHLSISAINTGRRPIKIETASLREYGNPMVILLADSFSERRPKIITEESPVTTFLVKQKLINIDRVYRLEIKDATGKVYKKRIRWLPPLGYCKERFIKFFYGRV